MNKAAPPPTRHIKKNISTIFLQLHPMLGLKSTAVLKVKDHPEGMQNVVASKKPMRIYFCVHRRKRGQVA